MRQSFLCFVLLACAVPACSSPTTPTTRDTGSGSLDSNVPRDAAETEDAVTPLDTSVAVDTGGTDASDEDAAAAPIDSGSDDAATRGDAAGAEPGQCSPGPCTPTCFRPYRCVTVCGGPATECGCCPCAPGSIDDITCPPTTN